MRSLSLPRRDGMPIDVWVANWILALFVLLAGVSVVFYALGWVGFRDVLEAFVWTLVTSAYFYGRGVLENQRHLAGDLEDHERRIARSHRDFLALLTALSAGGAAVIGVYLAVV